MTAVSDVNQAGMNSFLEQATGSKNALGKDDFLTLLVTQLQNQDPLNPSDPTEFTAQLAQFSSLEQLFAANESLGKMAAANSDVERLSALSVIGKTVVSDSGQFRLGESPVELGYRLETPASEVSLHVLDGTGRAVAEIPCSETGAGEHFLSWDGRNAEGDLVPAGEYSLVARAVTGKEEAVESAALVRGKVTGVDLGSSGSLLVSTAGDFRLGDVVSVREM